VLGGLDLTCAVRGAGAAYRLAYVETYKSGVVSEVRDLKGPFKVLVSSITASDSETSLTQRCYQYLSKYAGATPLPPLTHARLPRPARSARLTAARADFNTKLAAAAAAGDREAALRAWVGGAFALRLVVDALNPAIPRSVGPPPRPPAPARWQAGAEPGAGGGRQVGKIELPGAPEEVAALKAAGDAAAAAAAPAASTGEEVSGF
jgi:hypothetical protein